jgi:hypothetical protein
MNSQLFSVLNPNSIVRAFLIEEQKIVKAVMRARKAEEVVKA